MSTYLLDGYSDESVFPETNDLDQKGQGRLRVGVLKGGMIFDL